MDAMTPDPQPELEALTLFPWNGSSGYLVYHAAAVDAALTQLRADLAAMKDERDAIGITLFVMEGSLEDAETARKQAEADLAAAQQEKERAVEYWQREYKSLSETKEQAAAASTALREHIVAASTSAMGGIEVSKSEAPETAFSRWALARFRSIRDTLDAALASTPDPSQKTGNKDVDARVYGIPEGAHGDLPRPPTE